MAAPISDSDLRDATTQKDYVLIVLAGPNGAGKSTFYQDFLSPSKICFVNADLIARAINPEDPLSVANEAARLADKKRQLLVAQGATFCMETVFSDPVGEKLKFLREAQDAGYTVFLVFIGIDNPQLSKGRVIQRVADGGHNVSEEKIRARFPRTLENLRQAVEFANYTYLFDNSVSGIDNSVSGKRLDRYPYRYIAKFKNGKLIYRTEILPDWTRNIGSLVSCGVPN